MKRILIFTLPVLLSASAFAKRPYGVAGCGLGHMVFHRDNQVMAATTNTTGSQLFGITSGTSNCVDQGGAAAQIRMPPFVEANRLNLANDVARGTGETIANLSEIMGCKEIDLVGTTLQKNYERIFNTENGNAKDISDSIVGVVKSEALLASDCKQII